jgi:glutathione S-transferase
MAIGVVKARKTLKVPYPHLYASEEACPAVSQDDRQRFNCVQRGMQNSLEMLPSFLALLAAAGVAYPWTASGLGAAYLAGRISYFRGYSTGDPAKRINAGTSLMYVGALGLAVTAGKAAVEALLRGK